MLIHLLQSTDFMLLFSVQLAKWNNYFLAAVVAIEWIL